jgi:hypothetical protein
MKTLNEHCSGFHAAIFAEEDSPERALSADFVPAGTLNLNEAFDVYRDGYSARAGEALGEIYETLWMFLGDDEFFGLVERYIGLNPSKFQNLYHWGAAFPAFLSDIGQEEVVIELARFCWIHNELFHRSSKEIPVLEIPGLKFQREFEIFKSPINVAALWVAIHQDATVDGEIQEMSETVLYLKDQRVHFSKLNIDSDFLLALRELSADGILSLEKLFEDLPQEATDSSSAEEQVQNLFQHLRELGLFFSST